MDKTTKLVLKIVAAVIGIPILAIAVITIIALTMMGNRIEEQEASNAVTATNTTEYR